ncbi:hypothetical protein ACEWY4_020026 [Coilia grayii]|uniref:Uncharacterized protein n=1 Tax=Coilia grayii TaxID=363190 RepID=A0ABD1JBG0_9TELE
MLVLSVLEFIVSICVSAFACKATCYPNTEVRYISSQAPSTIPTTHQATASLNTEQLMHISNQVPPAVPTSHLSAAPLNTFECLPYCLCDMRKVGFCVDKMTYDDNKALLRLFITLMDQGSVDPYITVEDVLEWIFRHAKKMFKQWFPDLKDDDFCLAWEVNARLKIQDVEQEVRRDLLDRPPFDPASPASGHVDTDEMTPDELKMPVVKRIVGDLQLELKYYQCSRLQNCSEIVADIVTRLLFIVKTDPKGSPYNGSSMHLTELAMEVVRAVLKKLSSVSPSMHAHYSRPAAARMAYSIHQKLVRSLYTSDDMKDFLSTRNGTLMTAIAEHVSRKIGKLFQHPFQHLKPPSIVRLFMTASNYRSSLRTGERLVVDIEAVTSVVTLVLQQLYSGRDTEFVF